MWDHSIRDQTYKMLGLRAAMYDAEKGEKFCPRGASKEE
jgi:hypothetical protein